MTEILGLKERIWLGYFTDILCFVTEDLSDEDVDDYSKSFFGRGSVIYKTYSHFFVEILVEKGNVIKNHLSTLDVNQN